jgi:hypothetical protein
MLGAFAHQKAPHVVELEVSDTAALPHPLRELRPRAHHFAGAVHLEQAGAHVQSSDAALDDLPGHRRQRQNERFVVFCRALRQLDRLAPSVEVGRRQVAGFLPT